MNAVEAGPSRRPLLGSVRAAYLACVVMFGWAVWQFYEPVTGFTSLISIGDAINQRQMTKLRRVPHFVYEDSAGYDGAYYVQLALYPTLQNPRLATAIDNLPYRARRILFCWVAWAAGLDQPGWIVQAHALLNVVCWFALAWVLLRWFPPTSWENFLRWFCVMFSHGVCMSVRDSLVDGPALLLIALALAAWEEGRKWRATVLLGLAGLGRETSLLVASVFAPSEVRDRAGWRWFVRGAVLAALPLLLWMFYLRVRLGPANETGLNNFSLPLSGLAEKWGTTLANRSELTDSTLWWATLAMTAGLTVQTIFFAVRWRPREIWWRVGATFAALVLFLAQPVWEGFPGAAGRVLLPMTLAFNILVPRGRRWLAVLIVGNLTVLAGFKEFTPPREFYRVTAPGELVSEVKVERIGDWYGAENSGDVRWRWSKGRSGLRIRNNFGFPLMVTCEGEAQPAHDERKLRISVSHAATPAAGDAMVWSGELEPLPRKFQFGFTLPPGDTMLSFTTDKPGHSVGSDPRQMAVRISNLSIVVRPAPAAR